MLRISGLVLVSALVLGSCAKIDNAPDNTVKGITQLALDDIIAVSVTGEEPAATLETEEYVGSIAWENVKGHRGFSIFEPNTVYKAVVFFAAKTGYSFAGSGNFTHTKADNLKQEHNNGGVTVTVTFPATVTPIISQVSDIAPYLAKWQSPVSLKLGLELSSTNWQAILEIFNTADKDILLDLSPGLASTSTAQGGLSSTGGVFDCYGADADKNRKNGKKKIQELILPDAALAIAPSTSADSLTFKNFTSLKKVSGANIETVGDLAFMYSTLKTVAFPKAAIIGEYAFFSCFNLTTVDLPMADSIGNSAFEYCLYLETIDISAVESIGYNAFKGCNSLETIDLSTAEFIYESAFSGCTSLETIDLSAATSIGNHAFVECTSLKTIDLSAAASIGNNAFYRCNSLETIDLSAATSIGNNAFSNCTSLETLTLGSVPPTVGTNMFEIIDNKSIVPSTQTITIKVPSTKLNDYNPSSAYSNSDDTSQNWGNAFRGMGWFYNEWASPPSYEYNYGTVNTNIQLEFDTY
jgi:hypothetical protein